jgi:hypothetical protein
VTVLDAAEAVLGAGQLLCRGLDLVGRGAVALVGEELEAGLARGDLGGGGAVLVGLGEGFERRLLGGVEGLAGFVQGVLEFLEVVAGLELRDGVGGELVEGFAGGAELFAGGVDVLARGGGLVLPAGQVLAQPLGGPLGFVKAPGDVVEVALLAVDVPG